MRRAALLLATGVLLGAPAAAGAASVDVLVVGKGGDALAGPKALQPKAATAKVGGKRCAVATGTPLAALLRTRLTLGLRDYGSCGRGSADSGSLFVRAVDGQRARGQDGWVYKVGGKVPALGAADPAARIRKAGRQLLWFWCDMGAKGCQRTLEVVVETDVAAAGQPFVVRVVGRDDRGKAKAVAGATVAANGASATTGADGRATLTAPSDAGALELVATRKGLVRSFPAEVDVR